MTTYCAGGIPSELGQLTNLATLYLHENQLSGTIPSELGQLNQSEKLIAKSKSINWTNPRRIRSVTFVADLVGSMKISLAGIFPLNFLR